MNIKVLACIFSVDNITNHINVLSTSKKNIILPTIQINNPRDFYNELRYNIKQLFHKNFIKFLEEIYFSFIEIENPILSKIIEKHNNIYSDITEKDLVILCSSVMHKKAESDLNWVMCDIKSIRKQTSDTEKLINYVLQKMII